jgi:hypothetical protein
VTSGLRWLSFVILTSLDFNELYKKAIHTLLIVAALELFIPATVDLPNLNMGFLRCIK